METHEKVRIPDWIHWKDELIFSRANVVQMPKQEATQARELLSQLNIIRKGLKDLCPK